MGCSVVSCKGRCANSKMRLRRRKIEWQLLFSSYYFLEGSFFNSHLILTLLEDTFFQLMSEILDK